MEFAMKKRKFHMIASILIAAVFSFCRYDKGEGLLILLLSMALVFYLFLTIRSSIGTIKKDSYFLLGMILLLGLSSFITDNKDIQTTNNLGIFLLTSVTVIHNYYFDNNWSLTKYLGMIVKSFFNIIPLTFLPVKEFRELINYKKIEQNGDNAAVAKKENMSVEELMPLVASGKVAICANKHHTCLDPNGVGSMLRTKINVNLGVSRDCKDYDAEMKKVDLALKFGAEAIMDLIEAKSDYALKASENQLQGKIYDEVVKLRKKIIYEIAFIESAIDDPEHISLDGYTERLMQVVDAVLIEIEELIKNAENGKLIKEGIDTVIVGKPNAGKSSLLNRMLGEEKAIVTDIAGTTRDIIQESMKLGGIYLNLIDTAGIHETNDVVEKIGVGKAKECIEKSDLVVYVVDASVPLDESDQSIIKMLSGKKVIVLLNKSDMETVVYEQLMKNKIVDIIGNDMDQCRIISTSTKEKTGLREFEEQIRDMFFTGEVSFNDEVLITNVRQERALVDAKESLCLVKQSLKDEMPEDFYSIDLMNAYASLGSIIGEEVEDDLVQEIFSKFCMGK